MKNIPIVAIPKGWITKKSILVIGSKTFKVESIKKGKAIIKESRCP